MDPILQNSEEPKKSWFSSHIVLGYVFLFAVGAAAVASVYYWQTVKQVPETIDLPVHREWKAYTNTEYGFEFKYPESWTIIKDQFGSSNFIKVVKPGTSFRIIEFGINVGFYTTADGEIGDYVREIGGRKAYQYCVLGSMQKCVTRKNPLEGNELVILETPKHNNYFSVDYLQGTNQHTQDELAVINQILSTFKFTEPQVCIQVITPAKNKQTGEVKDFPTPCDVPEGWELVEDVPGADAVIPSSDPNIPQP